MLWGSLFSIILCLLRRFKKGYLYYNITPLLILLFGCIFRCLLPLDFPGFTQNLESSTFYASINTALYTPVITVGGKPGWGITPLMIFFAVWIAGAVILTSRFLWGYFRSRRNLKSCARIESGPVYEEAFALCEKLRIKRFLLITDPSIHVPHVSGLLFPVVFLPDQEYTETELYYILGHELAHWKNGDMWVRLITILICYLFWWNPIIYLLLYRLDITLEFRCDATVVASSCISEDERLAYLNTILRVIEERREAQQQIAQLFSIQSELVKKGISKEDFKRRVDIIGDYVPDPKTERRVLIFTVALMAVVLVFSYRYILQPYYYVEQEEFNDMGGSLMTPENTYLVEEENGTFSLYMKQTFYGTINADSAKVMIEEGFTVKKQNDLEE